MEKIDSLKCHFGEHINNMGKEKLVDLCHKIYKDQPVEELEKLEQEDLIEKYQTAWMENIIKYN